MTAPMSHPLALAVQTPLALNNAYDLAVKIGNASHHVWRLLRVKTMDNVLRKLMRQKNRDKFEIFMGTLDAMNDNLIAEAIRLGVDRMDIVHSIFCCHETTDYLRKQLAKHGCDEEFPNEDAVLSVLNLGVFSASKFSHYDCADAVARWMLRSWQIKSYDDTKCVDEELDISSFEVIDCGEFERYVVGMNAVRYKEGRIQFSNDRQRLATVPHPEGITYLSRSNSLISGVGQIIPGASNDDVQLPHILEETANELVHNKCDRQLAWKLITEILRHNNPKTRRRRATELRGREAKMKEAILQSYKTVARFRTALVKLIVEQEPPKKRLLGHKREKRRLHNTSEGSDCEERQAFSIESTIFSRAKDLSLSLPDEQIKEFDEGMFESDPLKINMAIVQKLLEDSKSRQWDMDTREADFNARTYAILGTFNGKTLPSSLISGKEKTQYFYRDDGDTKSFFTPFYDVMLFATTVDEVLDMKEKEVQSFRSDSSVTENRLINFIALRASHEFDIVKREFRYGSDSFNDAEDLLSKGKLIEFVQQNTRRMTAVFQQSTDPVNISTLMDLTAEMGDRYGASKEWMLRELVSRYIKLGAAIKEAPGEDTYGRVEWFLQKYGEKYRERQQFIRKVANDGLFQVCKEETADSDRTLVFDKAPSMAGTCATISPSGKLGFAWNSGLHHRLTVTLAADGSQCKADADSLSRALQGRVVGAQIRYSKQPKDVSYVCAPDFELKTLSIVED